MPSLRLTRRISADPVSAALLLAGPAALDLAPGLQRVEDAAEQRVLVEATLPPDPAAGAPDRTTVLAVRATPPRRTPTSYVSDFEVSGRRLTAATGRLVLSAEPGSPDEPAGTVAELTIDYVPAPQTAEGEPPATPRQVELLAEGFLANFAVAAARRASAA